MPSPAAVFAAVFVAFYVAHLVGDHWIQTERQATRKGLPGWPGRLACLGHVASYTTTQAVAVVAAAVVLDLALSPWRVGAALVVSGLTHYVADRREPLRRLAELLGRGSFHRMGQPRPGRDDNVTLGTGAYAHDQSWHVAWLFVAALIAA